MHILAEGQIWVDVGRWMLLHVVREVRQRRVNRVLHILLSDIFLNQILIQRILVITGLQRTITVAGLIFSCLGARPFATDLRSGDGKSIFYFLL